MTGRNRRDWVGAIALSNAMAPLDGKIIQDAQYAVVRLVPDKAEAKMFLEMLDIDKKVRLQR